MPSDTHTATAKAPDPDHDELRRLEAGLDSLQAVPDTPRSAFRRLLDGLVPPIAMISAAMSERQAKAQPCLSPEK